MRPLSRPPFPYVAVRAALLAAGLALILLGDADGPLQVVAWCLVLAPLAGELAGSVLYLRNRRAALRAARSRGPGD